MSKESNIFSSMFSSRTSWQLKQLKNKDPKSTSASFNSVNNEIMNKISGVLNDNTPLTSLTLEGNNGIELKSIKDFSEALKNNTSLTSLALNNNQLDDESIKLIAEVFKTNASITSFTLYNSQISDAGVICLCETLKGNKSLKFLDLRGNPIGNQGIEALIELVNSNLSLTTLEFSPGVVRVNQLLQRNKEYGELHQKCEQFLIKVGSIYGYDNLYKEIQKFSNRHKELTPKCGELIYELLSKKKQCFVENYDRWSFEYDGLCKAIRGFSKDYPTFMPQCGELICALLEKKHRLFLDKADKNVNDYDKLRKEIQNVSREYPGSRNQCKQLIQQLEAISECEQFTYTLLATKQKRFLNNPNKKKRDYDRLRKEIQNFSKKYPSSQCEQLIQELEETLPDVNNFMETEHMKQMKEELARDFGLLKDELLLNQKNSLEKIEEMQKTQQTLNKILEGKNQQIDQLQNTVLNQQNSLKKIEEMQKTQQTPNKILEGKNQQIEQLQNTVLNQQEVLKQMEEMQKTQKSLLEESNHKIDQLQKDLRDQETQNKIFAEQANKVKRLEHDLRGIQLYQSNVEEKSKGKILEERDWKIEQLQYALQEHQTTQGELLRVQVTLPKYFDGLLEKANTNDGKRTLIKSLAHPEAQGLENLCLIPFAHELKNLEDFKQKGAIVSWGQLKEKLENFENLSRASRKRLKVGLEQLLSAWPEDQLQNKEAQAELDKLLLEMLREEFDSLSEYDEIKNKLKKLNADEIKQWFENRDSLTPERQEELNKFLFHRIHDWFLVTTEEKSSTYVSLKENMASLLVEQLGISKSLQDGSFPDSSEVLNQKSLGTLICEKKSGRAKALGDLIANEINFIKENDLNAYTYDRSILSQKAAEQISLKWLNGELKDPEVLNSINKMAGELLMQKEFLEKHGDLHASIKKKAVQLLFMQFDNGTIDLDGETRDELKDRITRFLTDPTKYPTEQKKIVQQEILQEFKEGELYSQELKSKCVSFLEEPLKRLKKSLGLNETTEGLENLTKEAKETETKEVLKKSSGDPIRFFSNSEKNETSKTLTIQTSHSM